MSKFLKDKLEKSFFAVITNGFKYSLITVVCFFKAAFFNITCETEPIKTPTRSIVEYNNTVLFITIYLVSAA